MVDTTIPLTRLQAAAQHGAALGSMGAINAAESGGAADHGRTAGEP